MKKFPLNRALLAVAAACLLPAGVVSAKKNRTDVTDKVVAAVKDESLLMEASNEIFGDTVPGVSKKLTVEYQAGDEKLSSEAPEGQQLRISAPAGKKLRPSARILVKCWIRCRVSRWSICWRLMARSMDRGSA
jgi:hypothetical protein